MPHKLLACSTQTSVIQLFKSASISSIKSRLSLISRSSRSLSLVLPLIFMVAKSVYADQISLDHLSLKDSEQLFRENNRELLAAKRSVEGSQADTISAGQRPNPALSINSTNFKLTQSNGNGGLGDKTLDTIVRVDQLIERGNKRELRLAAANDILQASQFELKDTLRQQKLTLRNTYYDLLLAQEKERVQETNQALYQRTLEAAELRFNAGDIAATDVSRIRVDALRAKNDLRQAHADLEKAQANLAYLIGKENAARNIVAEDIWPSLDNVNGQNANFSAVSPQPQSVLDQRPDVLAADARKRAADETRRLAESLKTRDIVVGVQYEHYPTDSRNTIGAGISIPLFANYQYQGEIARAEVNYTAAMEAQDQARASAVGEITRAKADLEAATEKLERFDQQMLAEAKKAADAAEFAYTHGAMGVTDLLDSRRILRTLQLEAATVRADYAKSLAAWQAAINPEESE